MSANRLWLWVLLLAGIGTVFWYRSAALPAVTESKKSVRTRVAFITGGSENFWKLTVIGAEAAAKAHNVELQVEMPQAESAEEQIEILAKIDHDAVDGCAVSPLNAKSETVLLNSLAKDMHLVTFDSDAPLSNRQFYIGTSNYQAGKFAGDMVREALPEGGKVCVLISVLNKNNLLERKEGYEKSVQKPLGDSEKSEAAWETVAILTDAGDLEKSEQNVRQALEANEDIACFVGLNGYHGPALLKVLSEANQLGKIKIIAFDEDPVTLQGIVDGTIHATIAQDPFNYGYEAVRMLTALHNNKTSELPTAKRGSINVNCEVIQQGNVEEFMARLQKRLATAKEQKTPEKDLTESSANSAPQVLVGTLQFRQRTPLLHQRKN